MTSQVTAKSHLPADQEQRPCHHARKAWNAELSRQGCKHCERDGHSVVHVQVAIIRMIVRLPALGHVRATYMLTGVVNSRPRFRCRALPDFEDALELV